MNRCSPSDGIQKILIHFLRYFDAVLHVPINHDAIVEQTVVHIVVDDAIDVADNMDGWAMVKVKIDVFVVRLVNAPIVASIRLIHFAILRLVEFVVAAAAVDAVAAGVVAGVVAAVVAVDNVVALVGICYGHIHHDDRMKCYRDGDDERSGAFFPERERTLLLGMEPFFPQEKEQASQLGLFES